MCCNDTFLFSFCRPSRGPTSTIRTSSGMSPSCSQCKPLIMPRFKLQPSILPRAYFWTREVPQSRLPTSFYICEKWPFDPGEELNAQAACRKHAWSMNLDCRASVINRLNHVQTGCELEIIRTHTHFYLSAYIRIVAASITLCIASRLHD